MSEPTVREQVTAAMDAEHAFIPAHGLPVTIDFDDAENPYELSQVVIYDNGIVRVSCERGFRWDGASIPSWWPVAPWVLTLIGLHFWNGWILWVITAVLVAYTLRLLPYMQQMGRHARAAVVHDKLYRAQKTDRLIADAIMLSIMEYDKVPFDVRWLIYSRLRRFGWLAWRRNKRSASVRTEAANSVRINRS